MRARWILSGTVMLLAATCGSARGQGRGHGHDGDRGLPPGQARKQERREVRFDDHDRQVAHNWYVHEHRDPYQASDLPPGLRDRDRLPPAWERRLRRGYVIDRGWRERVYPAPSELVRVFAPPPPGCRYVLFGGQLLLVDRGYRVFDVIHLEIDFGM